MPANRFEMISSTKALTWTWSSLLLIVTLPSSRDVWSIVSAQGTPISSALAYRRPIDLLESISALLCGKELIALVISLANSPIPSLSNSGKTTQSTLEIPSGSRRNV